MALRRETLEAIGGFVVLRDQLADDYALGAAVRRAGRRVVLSHHLVDTMVDEQVRLRRERERLKPLANPAPEIFR